MTLLKAFAVAAIVLLAGCASKPVPQEQFYRLLVAAPSTTTTATVDMMVVEAPRVSGIYSERAIVYGTDGKGMNLQQYHYALWAEPLAQLLQSSFIDYLRGVGIATTVAGEVGRAQVDVRVSGRVHRFERSQVGDAWNAVVEIELRADRSTGSKPLLVQRYQATVAASDASMESSIRAFGAATEKVYADFTDQLRAAISAEKTR